MVDLNIDLPESFFEEEVRSGYTVTRKTKELWAVQLDLLNEFKRVCEKYNLKYFACGGTLLGAVRHNGFIPWDDDIDIAMFRDDYEKLKSLGTDVFNDGYFLQSTYNDDLVRGHMQLRKDGTTMLLKSDCGKKCNSGIFIDIFVYDNVPDNDKELNELKNKMSAYFHKLDVPPKLTKPKRLTLYFVYRQIKRTGKRILCKIILAAYGGKVKAFQNFEAMAQSYNDKNTGKVANISFLCTSKKIFVDKKSSYDEFIFLPFENLSIPCPSGYDQSLTTQYGDYKKFVTGKSLHGKVFYDVSNSYTKYISLPEEEFNKLFDNK